MEPMPDALPPGGPETMISVTQEEKLWAMLAHLFGLLGYTIALGQYVAPLVVYIAYKEKSKYVAFHALQSLYFQLLVLASLIASVVVAFATCGIGAVLPAAIGVGALIYVIIAAIQAYDGKLFEYWLVGKWARDSVGI